MAEEGSYLRKLDPLARYFPAVTRPKVHVHFRNKLLWTIFILLIYFVMCNIPLFGIKTGGDVYDPFFRLRWLMGGASSSIVHLGIGPIVTASIIMQLFVGAKIFNLDMSKSEDKRTFQSTQKVLIIIMIFIEAIPLVFGYIGPSEALESSVGWNWSRAIIVAQLAVGAYIIYLMDGVVSNWGIGSGVSLFIAAGVSQQLINGTFSWLEEEGVRAGVIPQAVDELAHSTAGELVGGGFEGILLGTKSAYVGSPNTLIALFTTILIFFLVVYVESTRVELPVAHGRVRGARGRYPIKLIYASVIPVILVSALIANVQMFGQLLWGGEGGGGTWLSELPYIGGQEWIGAFERNTPVTGICYYLSTPNGLWDWLLPLVNPERYTMSTLAGREAWQIVTHVVVYLTVMIVGSIIFARFWIETTNMGSRDVAAQIERSGMQIPGFRRDPRVLERVLSRYIPAITIISGAFVGALSAFASMLGTVGGASGTGVLLVVSILIDLYETMSREQMMEMHPVLRSFLGG
jgi:preprotein translocase subunit SecY